MNSQTEALESVLSDPWPDGPRLAFARAVEASDPGRSQYIQLSLNLARQRRACASYADRSATEFQMRKAANHVRLSEWMTPVLALIGDSAAVNFGRGFAEGITINAALFLERAPAIYAVAPILDLRVSNLAKVADQFFQSPHLSRIRSLAFSDYPMSPERVGTLAQSPFLGKLRMLNLYFQPCGSAGFERLAESELLPELQWVGGGGSARVGDAHVETPDVNPLPKEDESGVYGYDENLYATSLVRRFGARPWLSEIWRSHEAPHPEALSPTLD